MTTMELLVTVMAAIALTAIATFIVIAAIRVWDIGRHSSHKEQDETVNHFAGYFDKFGNPITEGDALSDGEHTYWVYYNTGRSRIDAYGATGGLIQDLSPREAAKLERVGCTIEISGKELLGLYTKEDFVCCLETSNLPKNR